MLSIALFSLSTVDSTVFSNLTPDIPVEKHSTVLFSFSIADNISKLGFVHCNGATHTETKNSGEDRGATSTSATSAPDHSLS